MRSILRTYQEDCIKATLEHLQLGIRRQAISLPVGAGKTVIFSNLISQLPSPKAGADKTLVLAHREELLFQAHRQILKFNPRLNVQVEKADLKADLRSADVVVASVATLGRKSSALKDRLSEYDCNLFKCVIIDEAHHSAAPSYRRIMNHLGAFSPESHLLVWGCSATFKRFDAQPLDLFQKIVYHLELPELMSQGWLCPAEVLQIRTEISLDEVGVQNGDFSLDQLSLALNTPNRNRLIAETWYKEAIVKHTRRSTIVFAINLDHVYGLAEAFKKVCGPGKVGILTGKTDASERAQILDDFASGRLEVIINCAVLTEGTDLPRTDCVLLARPTCNSSLYIQMVGRGLRSHPEKEFCLVLDVVDSVRSPRRSLITFPSLLAGKVESKSKEKEFKDLVQKEEKNVVELDLGSVKVSVRKGDDLDSVSLEGDRLAWIRIPGHRIHVLEGGEFRIILLENDQNNFSAFVTSPRRETEAGFDGFNGKGADQALRVCIGSGMRLVDVMGLIDEYLLNMERETGRKIISNLLTSAFWRRSCPPSQKQIAILMKAAKACGAGKGEIATIFSASKGRAATCISRINFLKTLKADISHFKWSEIF